MPSALETLVKILKLEKEQGCKNSAVIGGLAAYASNWENQAHDQARKPEHHLLVDEIVDVLRQYEDVESLTDRYKQITYVLDRITGRVPPPPEYRVSEEEQEKPEPPPGQQALEKPRFKEPRSESPRTRAEPAPHKPSERPDSGRRDTQQQSRRRTNPGDRVPQGDVDIKPLPTLARPPRPPRQELSQEEASKRLQELSGPVTDVKGVGGRMAQLLERVDIHTVRDLIYYLPRRYDDYTRLKSINRLQPEEVVTIIGTITNAQIRIGRNQRKDFFMVVDDGSGEIAVTCFGQHFLIKQYRAGKQVVISGKTAIFGARLQMTNPEIEPLDSQNLHTIGIVPVYPLTEGLKPRGLRRQMERTLKQWADYMPEYIPEATLERTELAGIGWTLNNLHFPEGWDHLEHARRRLMFDDLLLLQLAVLRNRRDWQSVPGIALEVTDDFLENFVNTVFPYELTGAQNRAIADIRRDVTQSIPMNRLIQGDVGAGKTAVATVAMAMALANGKQAALMAPTSILAEQHYRGIGKTLAQMPAEQKPVVALLTSALSTTERESVYRGLADGSIDVVIGTHALIQEGVEFNDLAVAVIDEQHRFGVEQRGALRGKGTNPHILVMTATPIPRTLALTMYADLDLSIIDEKPPGRQSIETRVIDPVERERVFSFVESQLQEGRQTFIVHPLVEASDKIDARSAVEAFEHLSKVFFRYRVCLLHGRMKPIEKDEVMAAFANHEYDVMVTTSVAEVGVDVPNATVMVIEGANRFGLAQLHQFRGRVGRGEYQSHCILIPDGTTSESEERLKAMEETDDGFRLAEMDWKMRGPGDLVGTRQSGQAALHLAELMTPELVTMAQREAQTIYEEDPDLSQEQHYLLRQMVMKLHHDDTDVS